MNTERPDHDDAEARPTGSPRETGASGSDGDKGTAAARERRGDPAAGAGSPGAGAGTGDSGSAETDAGGTGTREGAAGNTDAGKSTGDTADGPETPNKDAGTDTARAAEPGRGGAAGDGETGTGDGKAGAEDGDEPAGLADRGAGAREDGDEPAGLADRGAGAREDGDEPADREDRGAGAREDGDEPADREDRGAGAREDGAGAVAGPAVEQSVAPAADERRDDELRGGGPRDSGPRDSGRGESEPRDGWHAGESRDGEPAPPRRRSAALVASVAAAVLLVGGGGAYLAATASGGSGGGATPGANGDGTPPPLVLDGYSEGGAPGVAPGEPNPYGATYRAEGALPDGPGSAPVYGARGQVTREQVVALAKALGVDGKPVAEGESWRIGGQDGAGPTLRVDRDAPGTWTFSRHVPGTDDCKGDVCQAPPADARPVGEEAARKAAAPVLKAVGQDAAKIDAGQVTGANRVVNADPEIGGLPTYGWTTGVIVGADGTVVGGSGRLAAPVKGDAYPVVDADRALKLMNAAPEPGPRGGIGGCATPVPLEEPREECGSSTGPARKETLTVERAVFGLAAHSVGGRQALVPSWLFEVRPAGTEDALTVTHPAVDPEFLASPTSEQPSPRPSAPGDGPTSAPAPDDVEVEGYTAEGDELTVTFTGGVCADYRTTAVETGGEVKVTVTEKPWPGKVCIMIAKQYQQTVRLDAPLGDREVVGSDGEPVPLRKDGARLPAPPSGTR
ncbi:hypothetical protein ACFYOV_01140 [Streptomyces sp. NPDC005931]|uniref:hypothetical protein n=1 Tax=Streptomyces sp. NPDC005931 TaxID=3364737 RepID=UPI0036B1A2A8